MGIEWTEGSSKPTITWDEHSRDRQHALAIAALICATVLCFVLLAVTGPKSDAEIEGNATQTEEVGR